MRHRGNAKAGLILHVTDLATIGDCAVLAERHFRIASPILALYPDFEPGRIGHQHRPLQFEVADGEGPEVMSPQGFQCCGGNVVHGNRERQDALAADHVAVEIEVVEIGRSEPRRNSLRSEPSEDWSLLHHLKKFRQQLLAAYPQAAPRRGR